MSLIAFAIAVLIVCALIVQAVPLANVPAPYARIIQLVVIAIGALVIAQRAGLV